MIDTINKLPSKIILGIVAILGMSALIIAWLSYSSNQPFMFNGKEFGFGSKELERRTSELAECKNIASQTLTEVRRQLAEAVTENMRIKESNLVLIAQQQARARHDAAMWFPVDDVAFLTDGTFSTQDGERDGKGRWKNPDSELTLQLLEMHESEVVLGTNLPPPGNKIRLTGQSTVLVSMSKWNYQLSLQHVYSSFGKASVRIERRQKSQE
jgi:hypothetical protein